MCPEHRVRAKDYTVLVTVDEKKEIVLNVEFLDCAAAEGLLIVNIRINS